MCNKVSYESKSDATFNAGLIKTINRKLREKNGARNRKLRPYKCHICGDWHLTSQPKRKY